MDGDRGVIHIASSPPHLRPTLCTSYAPRSLHTLCTLRTPSAPFAPSAPLILLRIVRSPPSLLLKGLKPSAPNSAALPCPPQPNVRYPPVHKMHSPPFHHQAKESSRSFRTALMLALMLALMATNISWLNMATPGAAASYRSASGAVAVVPKHSGDRDCLGSGVLSLGSYSLNSGSYSPTLTPTLTLSPQS